MHSLWTHLSHHPAFMKQFQKCAVVSVCKGVIKKKTNATANCHPTKRQTCKNIAMCPHSPSSPNLALCNFWIFPKLKIIMKKNFESIQDVEAALTAQIKILLKVNCFRMWKECGISVFKVRGSILMRINSDEYWLINLRPHFSVIRPIIPSQLSGSVLLQLSPLPFSRISLYGKELLLEPKVPLLQ